MVRGYKKTSECHFEGQYGLSGRQLTFKVIMNRLIVIKSFSLFALRQMIYLFNRPLSLVRYSTCKRLS